MASQIERAEVQCARAVQAEKLRVAGATDIIDDMALLSLLLAERGFARRAEVPGIAA